MSEKLDAMPAMEHEPWNEPRVSLDSVRGQSEALWLAEVLESFRSSSHRTSDGVPMHLAIAAELRRLHAEVEENDRNLGDLTDNLIKAVALLRQAQEALETDDWQKKLQASIDIKKHLEN